MARRLLPLLALSLVAAAPAAASDVHGKKQSVDARLAHEQQLARSRAQETTLDRQVATLSGSIHRLERRLGGLSQRLSSLETDIWVRSPRRTRMSPRR